MVGQSVSSSGKSPSRKGVLKSTVLDDRTPPRTFGVGGPTVVLLIPEELERWRNRKGWFCRVGCFEESCYGRPLCPTAPYSFSTGRDPETSVGEEPHSHR